MKKEWKFGFYSVLKNEDANPYIGDGLLAVADGLGGSGSEVHIIDRAVHTDLRKELKDCAFGDFDAEKAKPLTRYLETLLAPMSDGIDDTSALWASRIVLGRFVYALKARNDFRLCDAESRQRLSYFISAGLANTAQEFHLKKGKYSGQLLLPTTLSAVRYHAHEGGVTAEVVWAGDSRCYALTGDGLKVLTEDDEDASGSITNLFQVGEKRTRIHYRKYELPSPCILFTASDGIFDPFEPYGHFGVEATLLNCIQRSNSVKELQKNLKQRYLEIRADDATVAASALGFSEYSECKRFFSERTDTVLTLSEQLNENRIFLQVAHQSEEEAQNYIRRRTADRFAAMVDPLRDCLVQKREDAAISEEMRARIQHAIARETELHQAEQDGRLTAEIETLFAEVSEENCERIQEIAHRIFSSWYGSLKNLDKTMKKSMSSLQKLDAAEKEYHRCQSFQEETMRKKEECLHRIEERIAFCRKQFDDRKGSMSSEELKDLNALELQWKYFYITTRLDKKFDGRMTYSSPDERQLRRDVNNNIPQINNLKSKILRTKNNWKNCQSCCLKALKELKVYLLGNLSVYRTIWGKESPSEAEDHEKLKRIIESQLLLDAESTVSEIVESLSAHPERASVLDGFYNPKQLREFRAYFSLKQHPSAELKRFEEDFRATEASYESLLTNSGEGR